MGIIFAESLEGHSESVVFWALSRSFKVTRREFLKFKCNFCQILVYIPKVEHDECCDAEKYCTTWSFSLEIRSERVYLVMFGTISHC